MGDSFRVKVGYFIDPGVLCTTRLLSGDRFAVIENHAILQVEIILQNYKKKPQLTAENKKKQKKICQFIQISYFCKIKYNNCQTKDKVILYD